ncbi:PA2169 family four-helix-bundle protein [Niabella hibiscisoli]|uniref:PA2169 family four-helix-bundle protein n=1 Tax=Niabella hibiscisoli TaxID=1825928 RepID=UPI001F0EC661|nr:PA2169 family four-helix-bundle protein [Niabella hibiscisoli]MCH5719676.1 PA2169 family four-helix-bundle protein [Niabella hibiscisoli]
MVNDLIKINNDRIEGYEKANVEINEDDEQGLKPLFDGMIAESKQFKTELEAIVTINDGEVAKGALVTGKLYRAWMGVKSILTAGGRRTILSSCETGEGAVQQAYRQALESEDLPDGVKLLIEEQQSILKASYDTIKELLDRAVAATEQKS